MEDMQPKKMIILDILEILKKHTDEDHKLSQQQIQELMEKEYGMKVDRKTVRRNLSKLIEFGFPVKYRGSEYESDAITRNGRNGEETILTDWYYAHEFSMLKGFEAGIRLSEYVKEHPNLWSGDTVHITFQCKQYMMNDIADSFGTDLRIEELPDDMMKVHVQASESSMLHWAIQFADAVEVLSPNGLREQITETLRTALKKYEA